VGTHFHTYNKIFLGYQSCQLVEWRENQRFEDHLRPRPQGTEVGFFAIEPIDAAGSPRRFYYT
jgi:hypothetical protein